MFLTLDNACVIMDQSGYCNWDMFLLCQMSFIIDLIHRNSLVYLS